MPVPSRFLTAHWKHLAMINYEMDPAALRPRVPRGTELDSWNGKTFVSMVGFLFLETKLLGVPVPFHRDFEEVNLRCYVRRKVEGEWRRGVVFVKEIVPRWAIAKVAQVSHGERYISLPMRHSIDLEGATVRENGLVRYDWKYRGQWNHLSLRATGASFLPQPESQEEFITEHYWGYATGRNGGVIEYRVEHPQWEVRQGAEVTLLCDVRSLYGPEFSDSLSQKPASAFLAEGSPVTVGHGKIKE